MSARLLIDPALAGDPALPALHERLRLRGTDCVVLVETTPKSLLRAAGADAPISWLATRDPDALAPQPTPTPMTAATAGLAGIVVIGSVGEERDAGVLVRFSPDLASAPIAMVPRGGGCWHSP